MADFLTTLKTQTLLTDGAMGSYLFELTGRLCFNDTECHRFSKHE